MSRYPGSQFILVDNTNVSAAVTISNSNPSAPVYLTTFRSPKGPEEIRTNVIGQQFYNLYGSQSKILFNKYKQPLLQASMDINTGAKLIAKRAVLDDAKLANATVALAVTYRKRLTDDSIKGIFSETGLADTIDSTSLKFEDNYSLELRPIVFSTADLYDNLYDDYSIDEKGEYSSTSDTIKREFKNLYGDHKNFIKNKIIKGNMTLTIQDTVQQESISFTRTGGDGESNDEKYTFSISKEEVAVKVLATSNSIEKTFKDFETSASTISVPSKPSGTDKKSIQTFLDELGQAVYDASCVTVIVPLFTVFDNGRGKSLKSISLLFDATTSKTYGYSVYTLKVSDYESGSTLESFAFSLNPYVRNNSTGYVMDIESSVNLNSNQIQVVNYYDTYDALNEVFQDYNESITVSNNILSEYDCLFGHDCKNKSITEIPNTIIYLTSNIDVSNEADDAYDAYYSDSSTTPIPAEVYYFYDYNKRSKNSLASRLYGGNDGGFNVDNVSITPELKKKYYGDNIDANSIDDLDVYYQQQYFRFFFGIFDVDIFNVDTLFPNLVFDANYAPKVKLAIQRLAAFRGDILAYLDMNTYVTSYDDIKNLIEKPDGSDVDLSLSNDTNLEEDVKTPYIKEMHNAVTCIYYDIRDPYTNKRITVTGTYGLSIVMVNHYITGPNKVFSGIANGIIFGNPIDGSVNYLPKIFPTSNMTSLNNIGTTYISDDDTIRNEKQMTCDLRVNYGSYYDGIFVMDTEYTLNPAESEYSYINNVMLVNQLIQSIRKACPSARYSFIDDTDLETYQEAVTSVIEAYRNKFASVKFKYVQDTNSVMNKIYYAALEIVFRPFAQAEIFTITALNYSTLSENVTSV